MPGQPQWPRQDPCRGSSPMPTERATLGPTNTRQMHWTGLGRHLCGGMQIFMKTNNSQDQMRIGRQLSSPKKPTRPLARSLPGKPTRHGKTLAGPPGKALAKRTSRATVRPTPAKSPPPFACSYRPNQLGRHLRGNMQPFVEAPPVRHLSCLPAYMAPHASLARVHVKARRSSDGRDVPLSRPR